MQGVGDASLLRFGRGIDGIGRAEGIRPLPDEGVAPALDTRPTQLLDALYEMPTHDQRLLAELAPEVAERSTLAPAAYAEALSDARALVAQLAAREDGGGVFAAALAVLDEAEDTRLVLDIATRALMRA